jgi:hypothetical protein
MEENEELIFHGCEENHTEKNLDLLDERLG